MIIPVHLPQSAQLKPRTTTPDRIIWHTTGSGLAREAEKRAPIAMDPAAWDRAAIEWYRRSSTPYYPQYLVGQSGNVFELAPPRFYTQHVAALPDLYRDANWRAYAGKKPTRHGRNPDEVYDWWNQRWGSNASPLDLVSSPSINSRTIAVDVIPDPRTGEFSQAQMAAAAKLGRELSRRYGIPLDRRHNLGHEDVHPFDRGTVVRGGRVVGTAWDPGKRFGWDAHMRRMGSGGSLKAAAAAVVGLALIWGAYRYRAPIRARVDLLRTRAGRRLYGAAGMMPK